VAIDGTTVGQDLLPTLNKKHRLQLFQEMYVLKISEADRERLDLASDEIDLHTKLRPLNLHEATLATSTMPLWTCAFCAVKPNWACDALRSCVLQKSSPMHLRSLLQPHQQWTKVRMSTVVPVHRPRRLCSTTSLPPCSRNGTLSRRTSTARSSSVCWASISTRSTTAKWESASSHRASPPRSYVLLLLR
jgi:hypothetical protein